MSRFLRLSLLVTAVLLMIACALSTTPSSTTNTFSGAVAPVSLTIQPQPTSFTSLDQKVTYNFVVTNNETSALAGPVTVADNKMAVQCPDVNTVGNTNGNLDPAESITCLGTYSITQADITATTVTDVATASLAGQTSNTASAVIRLAENKVLTITVSANPNIYNGSGQQIKYTYTIKNTGATTLGPAQFIVHDDHIPNPINCGTDQTRLAMNDSVPCEAIYTTTPIDATVAQIVNSVTASGPASTTIQPGSTTVTNTNVVSGGAFNKGSTIQHAVKDGEWMMQIARCYGASIDATLNANPQIINPSLIYPATHVTVPNIGSVTIIHGPPCVTSYTVKSGDTWVSIANDPNNNAAVDVLMEANQGISLSSGRVIRIPVNSKAYAGSVSVPPSTGKEPIRLNFPAGSPTVTVTRSIGTPETIRHVFTGSAGQILTVKLTVATNDVSLAIYAPNGSAIKLLDTTNSWSGTLTANGDHFIDLVSSLGATTKQYTLEVTLTTPTPAAPIERVVDINVGSGSSNVSHLAVFNGQLYFQADANDQTGAELWRYDGGLKAITRVADINTGPAGSEPAFLTPFKDMLYFRAKGDANDNGGIELWRFNGSATGRVTDINPLAADSNPMYLTVFKDALYFSAKGNDGKGVELWKYDGTTNPIRVTDINPETGDSNPSYLAVFGDNLYFSATSNDGKGTELWKYDGTNPATRVADINPDLGNSNPAFLTAFNGALYFSANAGNDGKGTELWKFDGTNPPTLAQDINPGTLDSAPTYLTVFNGALYFSANGDNSGFELWKFNGTSGSRVSDINPGGSSNPAYLAVYNGELYFQANANDNFGAELWKFKGP